MDEICLRLTHSRAGTRQSALRVLMRMARRGNERAMQAVRPLLEDRRVKQVRPAAETAADWNLTEGLQGETDCL